MTHLYLIRHGQAMSWVEKKVGNTRLSPLGVTQAERLRDRLGATGEIAADVLIASTLLRARQTAEIIAPALGLPITFDDEVQEWRDPMEAEGMDMREFQQQFIAVPFEQKPFHHYSPTAESWAQFMLRTHTALSRIITEHEGKTIVIVCHGGIIDASFLFFLRMSITQLPPVFFGTRNTSITHWRKTSYAADLPITWVLQKYNDTMHLRDIDTPARIPWEGLRAHPQQASEPSPAPTEASLTDEDELA